MLIAVSAIMGAYVGQVTMNEHARNLSLAINDATRVVERIRQQNGPCAGAAPTSAFPVWTAANPACTGAAPTTSWDDWLQRCGGGKSIVPDPVNNELVTITCQNAGGTALCGANEDPLRITVAVCWRHRARIIGECRAAGGVGPGLQEWEPFVMPNDNATIQSPAMLTTLVTCR